MIPLLAAQVGDTALAKRLSPVWLQAQGQDDAITDSWKSEYGNQTALISLTNSKLVRFHKIRSHWLFDGIFIL
jgi:hypothetical protein